MEFGNLRKNGERDGCFNGVLTDVFWGASWTAMRLQNLRASVLLSVNFQISRKRVKRGVRGEKRKS